MPGQYNMANGLRKGPNLQRVPLPWQSFPSQPGVPVWSLLRNFDPGVGQPVPDSKGRVISDAIYSENQIQTPGVRTRQTVQYQVL